MSLKLSQFKLPPFKQASLLVVLGVALVFIIICAVFIPTAQQFSQLANSFLHLKLYFLHSIGGVGYDPVPYHGHVYWSDGPFPAILLIPFVWIAAHFNHFFFQGYIYLPLILGIIYLLYRLAKVMKFDNYDALLLALAFCLGSVFIGVGALSSSWYYAQVLTTLLLFWSMYEYFGRQKPNYWLIGTLMGLTALTRITAAALIIFFLLEIIKSSRKNWRPYLQLFLPFLLAIFLIGLYNYLRFHNPFNSGANYQLIRHDQIVSRAMGLFSLTHIPTNLYSLFLRSPLPVLANSHSWVLKFPFIQNNVYGMSIFITSPYLLYCFSHKWRDLSGQMKQLLLAAFIACLGVLSFYGVGKLQYGYRYSLDFLPELYLIFIYLYAKRNPKLSFGMKSLLVGAIALNFYLVIPYIFP